MESQHRGESSFHRARNHFERKRKSFPDDRGGGGRGGGGFGGGGGGSGDHHHYNHHDDQRNRDYRDDYGNSSSQRSRRSRSPPKWERGKKQKQKTMTDVPAHRELFVGNIPSNIDERFLLNFLNGAMRLANLCPKNDTPCLSCQINAANFAFVEMVDGEMANKCLNLNGILFLNARIKVGRPKKYSGPFVVTKTWQEIMGETMTIDEVLDSEKEKVNRELFVGNTTAEMTEQMLKDFLGAAIESVGLNIMEGNPITLCELFGKYAFLELRTPREASNALNLNNIPFMGVNLQITRPAKWQGTFEPHSNWEHILARFNVKPEEFQLGQILNASILTATPTAVPMEGDDLGAIKAELAQVKRALDITRTQLDEANKKSEARKEQLVSLNKKWAEGKIELNDTKTELAKIKGDYGKSRIDGMDVESRAEAHELRRKHEETQGMLRGVTESLVKATEKLQSERRARKSLEIQLHKTSGLVIKMEGDDETPPTTEPVTKAEIDFASIRAEMNIGAAAADTPVVQTPRAADVEMEDDEPKLDSLKEFLNKTPKTNIDWTSGMTSSASAMASFSTTTSAPRQRDRVVVRLYRLLISCPVMTGQDAADVQGMAVKYNLGGYIYVGKPGFIVVEGLEFNCDVFMDNMERQKKKYSNIGKISERSGRAFPMELTKLEGGTAAADFAKAVETVGLKSQLDAAASAVSG